ncbi:hypothetical protein HMPREF1549_00980 [Actinomyces johnsonii F0510]|uniref:Uncharacterized protein n=1 Tax=Actinomyces johnsonii F0510 TaxID=1227262 RepID=U1PYJ4_9ACTO|nr:hypothetical protein HMPREF1549_00980 [Actinomyces johnsonii F0510]
MSQEPDCSVGKGSVTFQTQTTGAMCLQRLPTEMLTTQNLADDADGLIPVDRFWRIGLG